MKTRIYKEEILPTFDLVFGSYVLAVLLYCVWEWIFASTSFLPIAGVSAYLTFNLAFSRLSMKSRHFHRMERIRTWMALLIFCPLAYISTTEVLHHWWQVYLLTAMGAAIINESRSILKWAGTYLTALTVSFLAVTWYFIPDVSFYDGVSRVATVLIAAICTSRVTFILFRNLDRLENVQARLVSSEKMSALGEMAGGLAHEINTPLSVIKFVCCRLRELIVENGDSKSECSKLVNQVEETSDRIGSIVRGLRTFSRDGSHDPYEPADVSMIVEDALNLCRERFAHRSIQIDYSCGDQAVIVEARAVELSQVVLNLLNNAYDAVKDLNAKWVRINIESLDTQVEISITDSGSGIPNEVQDKLFQPFFTTKPVGKGTGLGLSISKGIVESHFGQLFVDGECANTRIVIRLPKVHIDH